LRRYIKKNLKKGFKLKEIKNKLYKKGLDKRYVKEIVDDILYKKTEKIIIAVCFLVFFLYLISVIFYFDPSFEFNPTIQKNMPTLLYDFCNSFGTSFFPEKPPETSDNRFKCFSFFRIKQNIVYGEGIGTYNFVRCDEPIPCNDVDLCDEPVACNKEIATAEEREQTYTLYNLTYSSNKNYFPCGLFYLGGENKEFATLHDETQFFFDVILAIDSEPVATLEEMQKVYETKKPGETVIIDTLGYIIKTRFLNSSTGKADLGNKFLQAYCLNDSNIT